MKYPLWDLSIYLSKILSKVPFSEANFTEERIERDYWHWAEGVCKLASRWKGVSALCGLYSEKL